MTGLSDVPPDAPGRARALVVVGAVLDRRALGAELGDVGAGRERAAAAPVVTITRIAGSAGHASTTAGIASCMASDSTLCRAGSLNVSRPIGPSVSASSRSVPVSMRIGGA